MKTHTMTKRRQAPAACLLGLGLVLAAQADVLEFKNGSVLSGKYAGGTAGTIRFETGGSVQVFEAGQILALTFTGGLAPAPALPPVAPK